MFETEGITTAIPTPYKNINTQSGNPIKQGLNFLKELGHEIQPNKEKCPLN